MAHILIVEDEYPINRLISQNLSLVGHECSSAYSGKEALSLISSNTFDLAILDIMLPDTDGFSLFTRIKPINALFLTARGAICDRVRGLDMGAEDYIVKPFDIEELTARVNAALRRSGKLSEHFKLDDTEVDMAARSVTVNGEPVELTPQEFSLLEALIRNRNIALSREKLLQIAWGMDYLGYDRTVDVHIQRLRKKLLFEDRIKTVYKIGYRLETK